MNIIYKTSFVFFLKLFIQFSFFLLLLLPFLLLNMYTK